MSILRIAKNPYTSLLTNFLYAVGNCILGFSTHSWWFITVGAYYAILAITRFSVLHIKHNANAEVFVKRVTGILLVALSFCIIGVNILSTIKDRGTEFHEIIMIAMATYTFTKITIAIIGMVKAKNTASSVIKTLRNISLADACVSIYTMQRSMLVTFPGMTASEIQLFNILTGSAVWMIVLFLGINLIGGKRVTMAKSKIVKASENIADAITGGYKKIEESVVEGFNKVSDKCIDVLFAKEGESVEDAKKRLSGKE